MSNTVVPIAPPSPVARSNVPLGIALGIGAAVIWGCYLAMARAGVAAGLRAEDVAFIRFAVAGAILLPWLLLHNPLHLAGVGWRRAAVMALLVGPPFIVIGVGGYAFAPLAHGAVMQPAALTIGGIALAWWLLGDRPSRERVVGTLVIVAGLVIIGGTGFMTGSALTPLGDIMFVIAGLMWALFTVLTRRWRIAPLPATAAVSVLSAIVYVPAFAFFVGFDRLAALPLPTLIAQIVVQGVLSGVVAVIAFTRAVELLGASRAAAFPAIVPAVAIALGVPIAHEIPTPAQVLGVGVVLLGLTLAVGVVKFGRLKPSTTATAD